MERSLRIRSRSIPRTLCSLRTLTIAVPGSMIAALRERLRKVSKLIESGPWAWNMGVDHLSSYSTWEQADSMVWDRLGGKDFLTFMIGAHRFSGHKKKLGSYQICRAEMFFRDQNKKLRLVVIDSRTCLHTNPSYTVFANIRLICDLRVLGYRFTLINTEERNSLILPWAIDHNCLSPHIESVVQKEIKRSLEVVTGMVLDF